MVDAMRRALAVLCIVMISSAVFAAKSPKRLLVSLSGERANVYTAAETLILAKSMEFALEDTGGFQVMEGVEKGLPASAEEMTRAAKSLGADCWLWVILSSGRNAPSIHVRSYDLIRAITVVDQVFPLENGIPLPIVPQGQWDALVSLMSEKFEVDTATGAADSAASPPLGEQPATARLVIRAQPGTRVTGLPSSPLEIGLDGIAVMSVPAPAMYTIRGTLDGYYPSSGSYFIDSDRVVSLDQEPGTRWAMDLTFFNALSPGYEAAYYILPDFLYIKLGLTTFLFGLQLDDQSAFFALPLTNLGLQAGFYIGPEDWSPRFYAAVGGFMRIVTPLWSWPRIDALSPGGFQASLGAELSITMKARFFTEMVTMLYMTGLPELFEASIGGGKDAIGYIYLPWGVVSIPNWRLGFRWLL
jgi:hypothetical protein